ncbi:MAG: hypothetical protein JWR35_1528 [Marmoricola sp.]|nr:hypothetical protein [Marmoricola sp.]
MNTPAVVAIAGSCTTRDNFNSRFNADYKRFYSCDLAANQTSIIAMMSPPVEPVFEPIGTMTDYDRWNVESDMSREFLPLVAELQPEYVILDFFGDIHFGVIRLDDGRYLTDNRWKLWRTDFYKEREAAGSFTRLRFQTDPEEYFALWCEAMDRFGGYLAEHCPNTRVIVHRGYNTNLTTAPGEPGPITLRQYKVSQGKSLSPLDVPLANALWARLDDYAIEKFGWASIDLRAEGYTSYAEHPWGVFYVHYTPDYYHRFLAELHKIHLSSRLSAADDDLLARISEIEAAAREHGEQQAAVRDTLLAGQRERLGRQRGRIEELEGLGVLRAAKFALGQRIRSARKRSQRHEES